jgi:hypothetical protein
MGSLERFILVFMMVFIFMLTRACVLLKLYSWFIMTVFGLPKIDYSEAIGIIVFLMFLNGKTGIEGEEFEKFKYGFFESIFMSFFLLGIGYMIFKLF